MKISIKAARVNAGYTQKELANLMNKHVSTINNWENGKSSMTVTDFKKLCNVLNMDEDYIFLPTESSLNGQKED